MKRKTTIEVNIQPMPKMADRYKVVLTYTQGANKAEFDQNGDGFPLYQAQNLLLVLHDALKPDCRAR
jgi:hypothetical protein